MERNSGSKALGAGLVLLTIGGASATIAPLVDRQAALPGVPWNIYDILRVGGFVLCGLGTLALVLSPVLTRLGAIARALEYIKKRLSDPTFDRSCATQQQFQALFEFSREKLGDDIDEQVRQKMLAWHNKNPEYLWIIQKVESDDGVNVTRQLAGYFSILPLNKQAAMRVDRGELYGGNISDVDMVGVKVKPAAVYIGGIAATTPKAKAFTLGVLIEKLSGEGVPLYTRPVTHDGQRLVRQYGFIPVIGLASGKTQERVHKLAKPSIVTLLEPKLARRRAR